MAITKLNKEDIYHHERNKGTQSYQVAGHGLRDRPGTWLCTSFAATGKAVKSGKTFLGQNFDLFDDISFALLWIKRAEGIEQLCLAYGGILECGLNSAGIGIGFNASLPHHNSGHKLNISIGCYLPKLLRQQTIGDALGVLCQAAWSIIVL
jgi:isopenicillin-N N-acyltransferase-like protein